jgi:uncharacterized protein (DUF934 family)
MPLLKNNAFVIDTWLQIGANDALPEGGDVAVPYARLRAEWDSLAKFPGQLGVVLNNNDDADELAQFLSRLALVILSFPAFGDGRSYSIAAQIRNLGFCGELRATGNILPDQLQHMNQVGFSTFEVVDRFPLQAWQAASKQMSLAYQRGLYRRAGEAEIWTERHLELAPWEEQPHAG